MLGLPLRHRSYRICILQQRSRLAQNSWRSTAIEVAAGDGVPLHPKLIESFSLPDNPPWNLHCDNITFNLEAADTSSKEDTPDIRRMSAFNVLLSLSPDEYVYWTDGSVVDGTGRRGGGIFICGPGGPDHQHSWAVPAGFLFSSY
jgi:hypothetical protein